RLGLEEYLKGVIPAEMHADWHPEALKAQAVAARSYVLHQLDPGEPFDVCADQDCQEYGGATLQHPATDRAVDSTEGLALTWEGEFIKAYYHSDSGGATASADEVWGEDLPYLPSREDVSTDSP